RVVCELEPASPETVISRPAGRVSSGQNNAALSLEEIASRRSTTATHLRRELSGDIKTILMHALRKEPEKRYRSIGELSVDLKNWIDGKPLKYARKPTRIERAKYWIRRNRKATLAMVLFTVLAPLGMYFWVDRVESEARRAAEQQARRGETL